MVNWSGVFPAVTTKLKSTGEIDYPATQAGIERLVANGVAGLIVLPMVGENASIKLGEKAAVIRAAKEVVADRVPLLSGLAECSTHSAVEVAHQLERFGAEGLMVFPSIGYKTDAYETVNWYRSIAGGCGIPIMIYNNPITYGVDVTPEVLLRLADTASIVAIKEETGDIRRVTDIYNELGDRFKVFCGVDDLILESVALGAIGWVSGMANAWPHECVKLFELCAAGHFSQARSLYRLLTPAFHLDTHVKLVQFIKLAEHLVYGAPEWTRPPRLPLTGVEREHAENVIRTTIAKLNATSPVVA
jgi:4-hydroxy-tetrahydrodipicolinate synthase